MANTFSRWAFSQARSFRYLIVVFWTPVREKLLYQCNDQFCLRFPLLFLVTFMLRLLLAVLLRRSEYNECKHRIETEEMAENDTYGHELGDKVLVVFVPNTAIDETYRKIESLRTAIAAHEFQCGGISIYVTVTFGIAEYSDKNGIAKAVSIADDRLYIGKK